MTRLILTRGKNREYNEGSNMKKAIGFTFLVILSTFLILFAQSQITTIAVLDFEGLGIDATTAKALTNRIRTELVKTGIYQVVERGKMDDILKEQGFQLSGCTSEACLVEAGQLLGVEKMLAGSISKVGNIYSVELRLIDIESGIIEKSDNYDMRGEIGQLLTSGMKNALDVLLGNSPTPTNTQTISNKTPTPLKTQNTTYTSLSTGTVTDFDGNTYQTVKIGNQWWMAENLKVTHYRNGDAIPNITDNTEWKNLTSGAYCNYDNDDSYISTYGSLYNWYAVNDRRNIAPEGWHVPTDDEWKQLEMYLGMSQSQADGAGWRGTDEGGKMKETGTVHWNSPNTGAANENGFSALPAGYRSYYGNFDNVGSLAYFWSATESSSYSAWYRNLFYGNSGISRYYFGYKRYGFSVRCVRD